MQPQEREPRRLQSCEESVGLALDKPKQRRDASAAPPWPRWCMALSSGMLRCGHDPFLVHMEHLQLAERSEAETVANICDRAAAEPPMQPQEREPRRAPLPCCSSPELKT